LQLPHFIVSSGRRTAMLQKAISGAPDTDMHHEYMVHVVQPLAVRRYLGLVSTDEAASTLGIDAFGRGPVQPGALLGGSSNKLSWLILNLLRCLRLPLRAPRPRRSEGVGFVFPQARR